MLCMAACLVMACSNNSKKNNEESTDSLAVSPTETVANGEEASTKSGTAMIYWKGTKVIGDSHEGTLEAQEVHLEFEGDKLSGGEIIVDMTSLEDTDMEEGEWKDKLEAHLASDDFFSIETHPTASIQLTEVTPGSEPNTYQVTGDLMIKDTTIAHTFTVQEMVSDSSRSYTTSLQFDRTKYGIKYNSTNFFDNLKDKAINDEVEIKVEVAMNK